MAAAAGSVQHQASRGGARFAAACDVLSRYVKATERATAAMAEARPAAVVVLPLMPGADVSSSTHEEAGPAPAAQLTISYGGRVVVVDGVPAEKAAELVRLAAAQAAPRAADDLPVARKASLQRFMEKRRVRAAARAAPYTRPEDAAAASLPDNLELAL
ncbi:hypothetical protein HU200_021847 [Digitaria exilis]|uniref:Protein TIFY n=1 Tax=Digitaria exilis TaxID=1010633 RepID=A0A835EYY5_9POAL|nr:hypothetical protein HU200_021847 [Digitaria exilis]